MQRKTASLLAIAATAVVSGVLAILAHGDRTFGLAGQGLSTAAWALTYLWYKEDVLQSRRHTSTTFNGLVISFTMLVLPVHFFRSRGMAGGVKATGLLFLAAFGWMVLAMVAGAAVAIAQARLA